MKCAELWVKRINLRKSKLVTFKAKPLGEGEARLAIAKFALTRLGFSAFAEGLIGAACALRMTWLLAACR